MAISNRLLIFEATRWLGIQEIGGNNRGQVIRMFQRVIGRAQNEPWCMSFVQYCWHMTDVMYAYLYRPPCRRWDSPTDG